MRTVVILILLWLTACSAMPSVSEKGFLGQSAWRHHQAIEDANIIMQGMNRARTDSESFAKQP